MSGECGAPSHFHSAIKLVQDSPRMRTALIATAALAGCAVPAGAPGHESRIALGGESPLATMFTRVARDTGVPANLLAAVSYTETRWSFATNSDAHQIGPLGLPERELHHAASLAGVTDDAARTDYEASLRAGAALLRANAVGDDFTPALRAWGGDSLAHDVEDALARGIDGRDDSGKRFVVSASRDDSRAAGVSSVSQGVGYAGA